MKTVTGILWLFWTFVVEELILEDSDYFRCPKVCLPPTPYILTSANKQKAAEHVSISKEGPWLYKEVSSLVQE